MITREKRNEYSMKWRRKNKDKIRKYYYENREKIIEKHKLYNRLNRDRINNKSLQHNYGITLEQYNILNDIQGGVCAICKQKQQKGRLKYIRLHVDHNHKTGKIRGLLCNLCNTAIGKFKESEDLMLSAIDYLRKNREDCESSILNKELSNGTYCFSKRRVFQLELF